MPDTEDILNGLLDSINKAQDEVDSSYEKNTKAARERAQRRREIGPDDDFVEKTGLSDVEDTPKTRTNLKRALSEDDFLAEFENSLDDSDSAPKQETREKVSSGKKASGLPDGDEVSPYFSSIGQPKENKDPSPKDDLMDSIESIVSNAKEKAGESILPEEKRSAPIEDEIDLSSEKAPEQKQDKKPETKSDSSKTAPDDDPFLQPEFSLDDFDNTDFSDTSAKDVNLMDESGDGQDLSDMLAGDGELTDIGDMLDADENGTVLPESSDAFESSAESEVPDLDGGDLMSDEEPSTNEKTADDGSETDANKKGFLAGLIEKLKGIFDSEDDDGKVKKSDILGEHDDSVEDLAAEDEGLLADIADDEQKAEKKKKEKKPKKEKEKKQPKEKKAKPKKTKKPKPVDNSPVIPGKVIGVFGFLAVSLFALIFVGINVLPKSQQKKALLGQYSQQNYVDVYGQLAGQDEKELSDQEKKMLESSKLAGELSVKYSVYEGAMKRKEYDYALDALIRGNAIYEDNRSRAAKLDIKSYYDDYGSRIKDALSEQFELSDDDAEKLSQIKDREEYTKQIDEILTQKGFSLSDGGNS
ncbi:MAG: hypothetical protein PUF16_01265 [Lachnospiraceae bacterium]|nr:hypothetical protein [Lachnospiraceae bacterium]